jgi:septum formation protein
VRHSGFNEFQIQVNDPLALVQTLSQCKAQKVANQFKEGLILGCDSILSINGQIYGKPDSPEEAIARWQQMRGNQGKLYTGHTLIDQGVKKTLIKCGITTVHFANISDQAIEAYVKTGEPLNCAGSFAIEGKGGLFVEKIEGCHSNVIGLSLPLLRKMLDELGYKVEQFWND